MESPARLQGTEPVLFKVVLELYMYISNMQNTVLIDKSKTVWHTKILMPFLNFSDNFHQDITFLKSFGNFEIANKTCSISFSLGYSSP